MGIQFHPRNSKGGSNNNTRGICLSLNVKYHIAGQKVGWKNSGGLTSDTENSHIQFGYHQLQKWNFAKHSSWSQICHSNAIYSKLMIKSYKMQSLLGCSHDALRSWGVVNGNWCICFLWDIVVVPVAKRQCKISNWANRCSVIILLWPSLAFAI